MLAVNGGIMDTIEKYQARRRVFLKIIPTSFGIFFLCLLFSLFTSTDSLVPFVIAALAICLAISTQLLLNRCPSCGKSQFGTILIKGRLVRTRGWALNPQSCPWCNAQLRASNEAQS